MMTCSQRIDEQAAEWAVRLHAANLAAPDQRALDEWLAADSRHAGALLRAQSIWCDLDRVGALAAGRLIEEASRETQHNVGETHRAIPRRALFSAAAAVLFALAFGAATWWGIIERSNTYVSDTGEVRRVRLEDGSNMVLNTATRATVRMDDSKRDIRLETGEGLFEVAKDPARPFIVHAGSVSIRALGTVFSVRAVGRQVDVTVTQGLVELIDHSQRRNNLPQRIGANEQATVTEVHQVDVSTVAPEQAERRLAWRNGLVAFDGETLLYAVAEMNRHNRRPIVIDNPALAERPVVGLFSAGDPENFAATVAIALGAESMPADDAIHLK